jgi:hypothetical protein
MTAETVLDILFAQLALEDPVRYATVVSEPAAKLAQPVTDLIRRVVTDTLSQVDDADSADESMAPRNVAAALADVAETLRRAASALWMSAAYGQMGKEGSLITPPSATTRTQHRSYLDALEKFATLLGRSKLDPRDLPATKGTARELKYLPTVFGFLGHRRSELRGLVHASASQNFLAASLAEMGASRGDEIASLYHTIVLGVELPEEVENWTLRDKPEYLKDTLRAMLSDVHHLVDAAEMDWDDVLAEAQSSYQEERES